MIQVERIEATIRFIREEVKEVRIAIEVVEGGVIDQMIVDVEKGKR